MRRFILCCFLAAMMPPVAFSQSPQGDLHWETLINERILSYPLRADNLFRLSAYAELKGRYAASYQSLSLNFSALGSLSFYDRSCLLRTSTQRVFSLNQEEANPSLIGFMDEELDRIFEEIPLLGNYEASPEMIQFVDEHLAKKNIEPFDKLFIRHLLVRYGTYDAATQTVEFATQQLDLPKAQPTENMPAHLVKSSNQKLKIRLDNSVMRGYYIDAGGTVFVEDVDRSVKYASGEKYGPNITAFKVFLQHLFVQSVQYVVQKETDRIKALHSNPEVSEEKEAVMVAFEAPRAKAQPKNQVGKQPKPIVKAALAVSAVQQEKSSKAAKPSVAPLYAEDSWIPMMLGILRARKINIGEPKVLQYFINEAYYPEIYKQMTEEEKGLADRFQPR
ncbi:MAG: hypothetical protein AAFR61_16180 [Bacteroidota bacterium]